MIPENLSFGGGVAGSVVSPVALAFVLFASVLLLALPRQKAVAAFIFAAVLVPTDQIVVLGSLHFPMLRILLLLVLCEFCGPACRDRYSVLVLLI